MREIVRKGYFVKSIGDKNHGVPDSITKVNGPFYFCDRSEIDYFEEKLISAFEMIYHDVSLETIEDAEVKNKQDWRAKQTEEAKALAHSLSKFVNSMSHDPTAFIDELKRDHRTLQQSMTRLFLKWIEYVGSPDYPHDLRNQESHIVCSRLLKSFKNENEAEPSLYLPFI